MLAIAIRNKFQNEQFDHAAGPLEFGRGPQGTLPRYLISDSYVSRDQLRVEELPEGRLRVTNLSSRNPATFPDGSALSPGSVQERNLPVRLLMGETTVEFRAKE